MTSSPAIDSLVCSSSIRFFYYCVGCWNKRSVLALCNCYFCAMSESEIYLFHSLTDFSFTDCTLDENWTLWTVSWTVALEKATECYKCHFLTFKNHSILQAPPPSRCSVPGPHWGLSSEPLLMSVPFFPWRWQPYCLVHPSIFFE